MSSEQLERSEVAAVDGPGEDNVKSWMWFGYKAADYVGSTLTTATLRVTEIVGTSVKDADYLRAAAGNGWLLLPLIGLVFGIMATVNVSGAALPPATWIFLVLVVLGIFDASAGLVATAAFLVGTIVTGHFDSLHAVASVFGLGAMWFGASKFAHTFRTIRTWDTEPTAAKRWWRIAGDIIILPIAGAFIMSKLVEIFPYLTGYQVPIRNDSNLVLFIGIGAFALRAVLQSAVVNNYRHRLVTMPAATPTQPWVVARIVDFALRLVVSYAAVWSFIGNSIQTWIIVIVFMLFQPIAYYGVNHEFTSTVVKRFTPRNLLKLAIVILFTELMVLWLSPHHHSSQQLLGWTFVALAIFVLVILILEQFRGQDWPDRWATRILGAASVVFFVLVIQGYVSIH
jgi:hypothetical protein